jgi:hypothetical protein
MDTRLIPECYVDTVLISVLGFPRASHKLNNSEVLKTLDLNGYNNSIGIGIIDRDKNQPKKLKEEYTLFKRNGNLEIKRKQDSKRFVIIHPNIEKWTFNEGQRLGIDLSKYNLPKDFNAYKYLCKKNGIENNSNIKQYFNALANKDSDIKTLKEMINDLLKNHS